MGDYKKNGGVRLELFLEPHTSFKVKMVGGLVEQEQVRLQE